MYDTVLVPTDGNEHARRAAEHGTALADAFGATLHVITVVDLRTAGGPFSAGGLREEFLDRLEEGAEEHDVDLVAVGTAGRTGPNRFLLGSTTERVIRHTWIPLLAVNSRDQLED